MFINAKGEGNNYIISIIGMARISLIKELLLFLMLKEQLRNVENLENTLYQ